MELLVKRPSYCEGFCSRLAPSCKFCGDLLEAVFLESVSPCQVSVLLEVVFFKIIACLPFQRLQIQKALIRREPGKNFSGRLHLSVLEDDPKTAKPRSGQISCASFFKIGVVITDEHLQHTLQPRPTIRPRMTTPHTSPTAPATRRGTEYLEIRGDRFPPNPPGAEALSRVAAHDHRVEAFDDFEEGVVLLDRPNRAAKRGSRRKAAAERDASTRRRCDASGGSRPSVRDQGGY